MQDTHQFKSWCLWCGGGQGGRGGVYNFFMHTSMKTKTPFAVVLHRAWYMWDCVFNRFLLDVFITYRWIIIHTSDHKAQHTLSSCSVRRRSPPSRERGTQEQAGQASSPRGVGEGRECKQSRQSRSHTRPPWHIHFSHYSPWHSCESWWASSFICIDAKSSHA